MPGTPSSVMTTFDGYPMAQQGQPERALALGIGASLIGGLIAGVVLVLLSPPLSRWAMTFSPWEYFTMVLMAIVLIASISQGSMVKGLIAGFLGMVFAMPGLNPSDGQLRLTFGIDVFADGFKLLPMLLGIFVMSQVIKDALEIRKRPVSLKLGTGRVLVPLREWRQHIGQHPALVGDRHLDRHPAGRRRLDLGDGRLCHGKEPVADAREVRHRPRRGHRRLGIREQRQCRRRLDPADHHGHPGQPDRRHPALGPDPPQHPAGAVAVHHQWRVRLGADGGLPRRQHRDVRAS